MSENLLQGVKTGRKWVDVTLLQFSDDNLSTKILWQ